VTRGYLALGDSYTIGEGVAPGDRWPARLAAAMRAAGSPVDDPTIVAKTGWTTTELLAALGDTELRRDHALVTLLIGVNDQYRGLGVEAFARGFSKLLSRAIEYGGGVSSRVVVVSIPDWSVTPFAAGDPRGTAAIAAEIDCFNATARDLARGADTAFVDVSAGSREARRNTSLLAPDGLHPSASMYDSWVKLVLPATLAALAGNRR
jgi:lysophospholipase L1-like esterase